jgi:hypothetical protein
MRSKTLAMAGLLPMIPPARLCFAPDSLFVSKVESFTPCKWPPWSNKFRGGFQIAGVFEGKAILDPR